MTDLGITTVCGENFSYQDSCELAFTIYRRFGRDMASAHKAWCRMLENNCGLTSFEKLVKIGKESYEA